MKETRKILIIEDNIPLAKLIQEYFSDFETELAFTGEDGIAKLKLINPEFVLLDLSLPDMNGLDIINEIKNNSHETSIIVVSGIDDVNIALEAIRRGASDYIVKPLRNMDLLRHTIDKIQEHIDTRNREKQYAERLRRHSKAAQKIQEKLFPPKSINIANCLLERFSVSSLHSSGDFIDYFSIEKDKIGFFIADVGGHGVAAAFLTILIKSHFSNYLKQYNEHFSNIILSPALVLEKLNQELLSEQNERIVTIFYGIINLNSMELIYENAGFFPQPILLDGNSCTFFNDGNFPLGFKIDMRFSTKTIKLPDRFILFLITDGIFDILFEDSLQEQKEHIMSLLGCEACRQIDNIMYCNCTENFPKASDVEKKIQQLIDRRKEKYVPDDISFLLITKDN